MAKRFSTAAAKGDFVVVKIAKGETFKGVIARLTRRDEVLRSFKVTIDGTGEDKTLPLVDFHIEDAGKRVPTWNVTAKDLRKAQQAKAKVASA